MAVGKEPFVNYGTEVRPSANAKVSYIIVCVRQARLFTNKNITWISKGRGLFATRSFKIGENIIEEEPLVYFKHNKFIYTIKINVLFTSSSHVSFLGMPLMATLHVTTAWSKNTAKKISVCSNFSCLFLLKKFQGL